MPIKHKLVVWDVDGPINHGLPESIKDIYQPPFRDQESEPGEDRFDFNVINSSFLKLTLEILHRNNINSVIGSQRIQMRDEDINFGNYVKTMYQGLDHIFGKDRPYLIESLARTVGAAIRDDETNDSKNKLLLEYQTRLGLQADDILFIDDNGHYRKPTEQAGHVFVHAPRRAKPGTVEDNSYLYETLLRMIPAHEIYKSIEQSGINAIEKNLFKKQLLTYQLEHLKEVTAWQVKVLRENKLLPELSSESQPSITDRDATAEKLLQGIQYLILDTKWNIGYFGGVKIVDETTGITNTIPKGMHEILKVIDLAQKGQKGLTATLDQIQILATTSADKKDHTFFNKRGETTQLFYSAMKEKLSELRRNDDAQVSEPPPSPLKK